MMSKKNVLIWAFAAFAGMLFAVAPNVQGDDGAYRLEGAWLRTSTLPPFPIPLNPTIRQTVTFTPTVPSGKRALIAAQAISADMTAQGNCLESYYITDPIGEGVMTGPDTMVGTVVGYGMRSPTEAECLAGDCRDQIECIWLVTGEAKFTSPDSLIGTDHISVYNVSTDPEHPLLPDPLALPDLSLSLCYEDTRLRIMPWPEPTPPWNLLGACPYPGE
jgi:hypothetical protein